MAQDMEKKRGRKFTIRTENSANKIYVFMTAQYTVRFSLEFYAWDKNIY